jgi:hypothetical protein
MTATQVDVAAPPSVGTVHSKALTIDLAAVVVGCLTFALLLFLPQILNDGDTLWQIRAGEWILDHHAIPATDPFSFTAGDRPWFAHEWLAETLMALAYRAAGLPGTMALAAAATGLTAAVLLRHLRESLPGIYAFAALVVALSLAAPSMLVRPHLIAWPCLALWCAGLARARVNRTAPSWTLLPVMLLWVNLHGSFFLGLLLPSAFLIEALLDPGADHRQVFIAWTRFIVAASLVALANPDLLAGVLFPIHLVGMKSLTWIGEWQPPDFTKLQPLELVILGAIALGFSGQMRLPPIRLILFLGLIHAALSSARNEQLVGIVGAFILAEPIGTSLSRGRAQPLGGAWRGVSAVASLIALAALMVRIALPVDPDHAGTPFAAALGTVPPSLRTQPVLNEYSLGGRLIFNGIRPFIDSRADLYGEEFLSRYRRINAADRSELDRTLSEYRIAWTIFPTGHPIISVLDEHPGWRRLVEAGGITIHVRENQLPQ